jgi:hypothetical protein
MPKEFRCPSCERALRLPETLLGRSVKCPRCSKTFTAGDPDDRPRRSAAPKEEAATESPAVYSSVDELEECDSPVDELVVCDEERPGPGTGDEEGSPGRQASLGAGEEPERRPRRRRRRMSEDEAAAAVRLPAIGLMIVVGLGLGAVVVFLAVTLYQFVQEVSDMKVPRGPGRLGAAVYVLLLFWGPVVMGGGLKMMRLENLKAARAACVVAMLPCNPFFVVGAPLGIWGLIVLSRPEVHRWFG